MRICFRIAPRILIFFLLSNLSWRTVDAHTFRLKSSSMGDGNLEANGNSERGLKSRRAVTEEEISYIANTLEPRECLSLLYLLHHAYKRKRRREISIEQRSKDQIRSAQITPCETMLLNYWRDPRSRIQKDCSHVSRTLRQVKRQDLARWLWGRRPSCSSRTVNPNGTNDTSSLTAHLQVVPIYPNRARADRTSTGSTLDRIIWIYIALAILATTTVLLCIHYLFKKFRKPTKYIALAEKDIRNLHHSCGCVEKRLSLTCNKKKRYFPPPEPGCACSSN